MHKQFLDLNDFSLDDLERTIGISMELKAQNKFNRILEGKFLGLIFEKSSTRTRVSFEVAMNQLGGKASFLSINDLQLGRGEPVDDTAKVLSSMVDGLVLRTVEHDTQIEFANHSSVPVINGLSNKSHPCQLLADLMTFYEEKGAIKGKKVAWFGDFNNVCFSYAQAADLLGFDLWVACPDVISERFIKNFKNVYFTNSIKEAVQESDLVTTDVWVSMGDESEADERVEIFSDFQVNEGVLDQAKPDAIFLHCLPAIRGQEISTNLLDDSRSRVWQQAENRLHAQKGLLIELLE
jgi:ornithine carbamoyltransferase